MPKRVLIVYYSQTGQLKDIVDSIAGPLEKSDRISVVFEELKPKIPFPFPWKSDEFFQVMPESVKAIPCDLQPLSLGGQEDFDLIILAWQPWFLSPSLPVHAFLQHNTAKKILEGKPVITLIGSRNMWVAAQERIREYLQPLHANLAGNIVLYDKAPNLLSVFSIIRWLFTGHKGRYLGIIPPAGISVKDIRGASRYGELILSALLNDDLGNLRNELIREGAVDVLPELVMLEKRGIVFFRLWASFILRKGLYGDPARLTRVRLFKYYLLAVLYLVSPFATLLFYITKPFRKKAIKKQISLYQLH
jgi:hypothetical protein